MSDASRLYPEAWSFCHFLMTAPEYGDPKSQIPNGKYWKVLSRYIQLLSKGTVKPEATLKGAFVDEKGKPLDLSILEKEWKEYILNWPDSGKSSKE